jgi:hypothetical protein
MNIGYIHEPFNPKSGLQIFDKQYKYLKNDDNKYNEYLKALLNLNKVKFHIYPFSNNSTVINKKKDILKYFFNNPSVNNFFKSLLKIIFRSGVSIKT